MLECVVVGFIVDWGCVFVLGGVVGDVFGC